VLPPEFVADTVEKYVPAGNDRIVDATSTVMSPFTGVGLPTFWVRIGVAVDGFAPAVKNSTV